MSNKAVITLMLVMGVFVSSSLFSLSAAPVDSPVVSSAPHSTDETDSISSSGKIIHESLFPEHSRDLRTSHFTWGAELGSSIDLSSHDMSTMDLDIILGYKSDIIRTAGIGIGLHRAIGNGSTFIPIYALLRSSFRAEPSLCFLHLKAGYSFNSITDSPTFGDFSLSAGIGFNLSMTRRCMTHIILAYGFRHFSVRHSQAAKLDYNDISLAQLSFGINF